MIYYTVYYISTNFCDLHCTFICIPCWHFNPYIKSVIGTKPIIFAPKFFQLSKLEIFLHNVI